MRPTHRLERAAICLGLTVACLSAAAGSVDQAILECSDAGSTLEINQCAASINDDEDDRMSAEFSALVSVLARVEDLHAERPSSDALVVSLRAAPLAWLEYRDRTCRDLTYALAMGGSVGTRDSLGCFALVNADRADRLKALRMHYEALGR
jgi:uncharacterized protein YecT (DUF1311 family)